MKVRLICLIVSYLTTILSHMPSETNHHRGSFMIREAEVLRILDEFMQYGRFYAPADIYNINFQFVEGRLSVFRNESQWVIAFEMICSFLSKHSLSAWTPTLRFARTGVSVLQWLGQSCPSVVCWRRRRHYALHGQECPCHSGLDNLVQA